MAQIDTLTLEVNADISKASQKLETLARRLDLLKESTGKAVGGYKNLARELSKINVPSKNLNNILKISNALTSLNSVKGKNIETLASGFNTLVDSLTKMSQLKRATSQLEKIAGLSTALKSLNDVKGNNVSKSANGLTLLISSVESMPESVISKIERLGTALQSIPDNASVRSLGKLLKGTTGDEPKESGTTKHAGASGIGEIFSEAKSKIAEAKSLNEVLGVLSTSLKSFKALPAVAIATTVLDGLAKAFKKLISPITNAVKALKGFIKSLARIAFYRFIRSILKEISQGLREGIQNLALYSKAMEGLDAHNANEVLSRFASAFLYLKNAIATAVIPVFRALAPVIEEAMFKIVDFINVLSQIGSSFFGSNFTKAKYFWVDYADSLDKTTGSAKALHHQLAQFDELNNLSAPSGGSGSDKLADASQMFEEAQIDEKIKGIVDKITNAFNTVKEMFEPVKRIVDKAKELFELSWEKINPNLKRIWNSLKGIWNDTLKPFLSGFISGFVDGFLSSDAWHTLPDFLGKISEAVADVVRGFERLTKLLTPDQWERLGRAIGYVTGWLIDLGLSAIAGELSFKDLLDRGYKLGEYLGRTFAPDIEKANNTLKTLYDRTVNLHNPTSLLSNYVRDLMQRFIEVKDKAKEFADKLFNLVTDLADVKKKAEALKTYWDNHNIFENVLATGVVFLYEITQIKTILDALKKLGEIVIKITLDLTNGSVLSNLLNDLSKIGDDIANTVSDIKKETENTVAQLPTTPSNPKPSTNTTGHSSGGNSGKPTTNTGQVITSKTPRRKALGGYIPKGDLFIANEVAPEMVGRIGGNTAVANNNQITEAIAQATYTAMARALSENGQNVNIVVEGDGEKMFRVFQKKQREYIKDTGFAY